MEGTTCEPGAGGPLSYIVHRISGEWLNRVKVLLETTNLLGLFQVLATAANYTKCCMLGLDI